MTDAQYDKHFKRIRQMLVDSGDYNFPDTFENESEGMLDTDTALILSVPHLNPEFF